MNEEKENFPADEVNIDYIYYRWLLKVKTLPKLPRGLKVLHIGLIPGIGNGLIAPLLESLPNDLPETLEIINVNGCKNMSKLPSLSRLVNLEELYCSFCPYLISLPDLPRGLRKLHCNSSGIIHISELPQSLQELRCQKSINLETIYNNFPNVVVLSCEECPKLKSFLTRIPPNLTLLRCDKKFLILTLKDLLNQLEQNLDCLDIEEQLKNEAILEVCEFYNISLENIIKKILICKENRKYMIETLYHTDPDSSGLISYYDTGIKFKDREINFEFKRSRKKKSRRKSPKRSK